MGNYKADRLNDRQAGIAGKELNREFFNSFHTYELYWYPDHVRFLLDGVETAFITKDMAAIPDKYMFLWIGSPLYQDGTYYAQSDIPFLKEDKHTIIDYIKIE
jgi:beta-glucanase (GH16 family)